MTNAQERRALGTREQELAFSSWILNCFKVVKVSLVSGQAWGKSNVLSLLLPTNWEFMSQCFLFQTHLFNQNTLVLYYLSLRNPHQSELAFSLPSVKLMEYLLPPTSWPGAQLDARYTKIPRSPSQS